MRSASAVSLLACLCALALLLSLALATEEDYYALLNVPRQATKREIKKSLKKLTKKYHPDISKEPDAEQKFAAIAHAYETLMDDEKRKIYDMYGAEGLKRNQGAGGGAGYHDPFDMFAHFFGGFGGSGGGGPFHRGEAKGPEINLDLDVDLRDLYTGATIDVDVSKQVVCDWCRGTGAKEADDVKPCGACGGRGLKIVKQMLGPGIYQQLQITCDSCGGKGKVVKSTCPACRGRKVRRRGDQLTVVVEKAMQDGEKIEFAAEGDESPDHIPGDVVFTVRQQAHPVFIRRGDNLYTKETITLLEALTGFERNITHLDGEKVILRRNSVTWPGFVQVLEGNGMPRRHQPMNKGKLFVEYSVVFPSSLDAEKQEAFKKLLT